MMIHTREYIMEWLKKWLQPMTDDSVRLFQIQSTLYEFLLYFRLAFKVYGVYKDTSTHEYLWFVFENDFFTDEQFLAAPRFQSLDQLQTHVANELYDQWNKY